MGSRMAADLQKNGHPLVLFNRTPAKAKPLVGPCATLADSPATLAEQVDLVFTMLANPAAVEESALGDNGFLDHLQSNALWVDCSSVNPSFREEWPLKQHAAVSVSLMPGNRVRRIRRRSEAHLLVGPSRLTWKRFAGCYFAWVQDSPCRRSWHGTSMKMVMNLDGTPWLPSPKAWAGSRTGNFA
jgi:hypothetical protein